jgi:hypothetical protein
VSPSRLTALIFFPGVGYSIISTGTDAADALFSIETVPEDVTASAISLMGVT